MLHVRNIWTQSWQSWSIVTFAFAFDRGRGVLILKQLSLLILSVVSHVNSTCIEVRHSLDLWQWWCFRSQISNLTIWIETSALWSHLNFEDVSIASLFRFNHLILNCAITCRNMRKTMHIVRQISLINGSRSDTSGPFICYIPHQRIALFGSPYHTITHSSNVRFGCHHQIKHIRKTSNSLRWRALV